MAPTVEEASANGPELKYLGFFRLAVLKAYVVLVSLYDYLKESSGIFSGALERLETASKSVAGPVYSKLEGKPDEVLKFVDGKVDEAVGFFHQNTPEYFRTKSSQLYSLAKSAPENSKVVYADVREKGVVHTSHSYFEKYQPVVKDELYQFWKVLLTLPFVATVAKAVVPQAKFGLEKYNSLAEFLKKNEVTKPVGEYLPFADVDEIVKTVKTDAEVALKQKKID